MRTPIADRRRAWIKGAARCDKASLLSLFSLFISHLKTPNLCKLNLCLTIYLYIAEIFAKRLLGAHGVCLGPGTRIGSLASLWLSSSGSTAGGGNIRAMPNIANTGVRAGGTVASGIGLRRIECHDVRRLSCHRGTLTEDGACCHNSPGGTHSNFARPSNERCRY